MVTDLESLKSETDPFGAKVLETGKVRFRIWMPHQEKILSQENPRLYFPDSEKRYEMESIGEGWYELETEDAEHGTRYAIEIWNHRAAMPGWMQVPDPMSYQQEMDVHGYSIVVDPSKIDWSGEPTQWKGRRQEDLIITELHIGTFTEEGTFKSAVEKLPYLKNLGVTAVELMPVGAVGCAQNWGYDEILKAAPHTPYGTPQDFADFVRSAHENDLAVILDVVDNHMGPEGNYYYIHTPELWGYEDTDRLHEIDPAERVVKEGYNTPWGPAMNLSRWEVRTFFSQKNLWLQQCYHLDGVRRDAVHALKDDFNPASENRPHFLTQIFHQAKDQARKDGKDITVILEYEDNKPSELFPDQDIAANPTIARRVKGNAQWGDDFHHSVRALLFREDPTQGFVERGYYEPYNEDPIGVLMEVLAKGSALSLETARNHHRTAEDDKIPFDPRRTIAFTRNHDQIGNTPNGERIEFLLSDDPLKDQKLKFESTLLMLNPMIPMMFMGQERALETPFPYFATWANHLKDMVREGRASEFPQFDNFTDPCDPATVASAKLPWPSHPDNDENFLRFQKLIEIRKETIMPHLKSGVTATKLDRFGETGLRVEWIFGDGARHALTMNPGNTPIALPKDGLGQGPDGEVVDHQEYQTSASIPPWGIIPQSSTPMPNAQPIPLLAVPSAP